MLLYRRFLVHQLGSRPLAKEKLKRISIYFFFFHIHNKVVSCPSPIFLIYKCGILCRVGTKELIAQGEASFVTHAERKINMRYKLNFPLFSFNMVFFWYSSLYPFPFPALDSLVLCRGFFFKKWYPETKFLSLSQKKRGAP